VDSLASNVVPITSRPNTTLSIALKESIEAYDMAPFIYRADQRLGRADMRVSFEQLPREAQEQIVTRAAIAIRLGDAVKAAAVSEHAAMGLIKDVTARVRSHELDTGDPEVIIDLNGWRRLAKAATLRALEYLGSTPRVRE
jgi:hemin uptake protein HemP